LAVIQVSGGAGTTSLICLPALNIIFNFNHTSYKKIMQDMPLRVLEAIITAMLIIAGVIWLLVEAIKNSTGIRKW